jgi:hypothetical protein
MRPLSFRGAAMSLLLAAIGACAPPLVVSDRTDHGRDDESVRPCVAGAVVALRVGAGGPFLDPAAVTATSSDETVFTVVDDAGPDIVLQTVAAGDAELVFKVGGDVVDSRPLTVRDPARIELRLEPRAERADDLMPAAVTVAPPLRVLRGREAQLTVHVFDADDGELFGAALTAWDTNDGGWLSTLAVDGPHSVIRLRPQEGAAPSTTMQAAVGGSRLVVPIAAEVAEPDALERIVLDEAGDDRARDPGRRSVIAARAVDAAGGLLLGAPGWQLEGRDVGVGAFVGYTVALPSTIDRAELVARIGDVEVRRRILADPRTVGVALVEPAGCAAASPAAGGLLAWATLAFRRRRRR